MRRKTARRSGIKRLTAFVPKTFKATKNLSKSALKRVNAIFNRAANTVRRTTKFVDKKTSFVIRSITKKRSRK
jgi:hypothetical protein